MRTQHRIAVSILACTQARKMARLRSIPAFAGRWNEGESSGIVEVQTHAFARTHILNFTTNVPSCSLLRTSMSVCSAADRQKVVASAGSSAYAAPSSMGRTVRSVLPITTARASCAYPA
jgi:hypothetical protein